MAAVAALMAILAACTSAAGTPPSARPSVSAAASPAPTAMGSVVAAADGKQTFTERTGAFAIDYPATWQRGAPENGFGIVNATPGFSKSTLDIAPSGMASYPVPATATTLEIPTGLGTLTAYRFRAPGIYGGDPYYADVISTRFRAGGREWVVEAVLLEWGRDKTIAVLLDIFRTLRSG